MNRRYLLVSVLVGALCGVGVVVAMTGLSGRTLFGPGGSGAGASTAPSPAERVASPSPALASPDPGSVSTAAPGATPSAEPPARPAKVSITAKVGRPTDGGTYRATTPVASPGDYITWRMVVDRGDAGKTFGVEVSVRLDGTWTNWTPLTSRVADARGTVLFSWRQKTPTWIRVRFVLPGGPSSGLQGRWR
jgi:hypothetical protein